VFSSAQQTGTSIAVSGLPTGGQNVYVRLYTYYSGVSASNDYTYTAATQSALVSPAPGSTLASANITFTWAAASGATGYSLALGSTGVGSSNLYSSAQQTGTSLAVTGLPTNGTTIYARLFTNYSGVMVSADYVYTAVSPAALTSPAPASMLQGSAVTFGWTALPAATGYKLVLGSTGVGSSNLYSSAQQTAASIAVTGLPMNGATIYARLFTYFNTVSTSADFTYTAATPASLTSPAAGAVLPGTSVTFTWTAAASAVGYNLWLGTGTSGTAMYNLYASSETTATSLTVNNLPTNGETIYARIYTKYSGSQNVTSVTYTATSQAVLTSPAPLYFVYIRA
jgi:hypothetical protein